MQLLSAESLGYIFYIYRIAALKGHVLSALFSISESVQISETVMQLCTNHPFIEKFIAVQITETLIGHSFFALLSKFTVVSLENANKL